MIASCRTLKCRTGHGWFRQLLLREKIGFASSFEHEARLRSVCSRCRNDHHHRVVVDDTLCGGLLSSVPAHAVALSRNFVHSKCKKNCSLSHEDRMDWGE